MVDKIPTWLSHKPVVAVDYEKKDATGDAKFLSIGKATWDPEDFSAKVWRWADKCGRWSRQSEELPLWRVLDLAALLIAVINGRESNLSESVINEDDIESMKAFIQDNMPMFEPKMMEIYKLLKPVNEIHNYGDVPNIFSFATSELSQDALLAWLIEWASPKYRQSDSKMHEVAIDFLKMLIGKDDSFKVNHIEVGRQWENIDVWVKINEDIFLAIEDKTNTSIHDDQLQRYKDSTIREYEGRRSELHYVYVKTGNEPKTVLLEIERPGYRTVSRSDILRCLNAYSGNNSLLLNYREYLQKIEDDTMSYKVLPENEWGWYAWEGFFKELESRLDIVNWSYVSNPSGGFLGAWWHFKKIEDGEMYLQFEQGKLCFKIYYEGERSRSEVRDELHNKLMKIAGNRFPEIHRPRFGTGAYMTIAVISEEDIWGDGSVDFDALEAKLKQYQSLIDECCAE